MKKQIKTLVAAGLVTAVSASTMITSNADSRINLCKIKYRPISQLICINSEGKLNIYLPNCNNNPSIPGNTGDNDTIVPEGNLNDNNLDTENPDNNNTVDPEDKPDVNPEDNNNENSNDNNVVVPETKPDTDGTKPPTETKPEVDNSFSAYQQEVLNLVNEERAKVGAQPLTLNSNLSNLATTKSQDMINKNYFDHNSPTYGSPFNMMKQFGISYRSAGENIAMGQSTPQEVMNSWMNSAGHRKNILSADFNELGVGIAKASNGQLYWTQMFIGK